MPRLPARTAPPDEMLAERESFSAVGATNPAASFCVDTEPSASFPFVTAALAIFAVVIEFFLIFDAVTAFLLILAVVIEPPFSSLLPIFLAAKAAPPPKTRKTAIEDITFAYVSRLRICFTGSLLGRWAGTACGTARHTPGSMSGGRFQAFQGVSSSGGHSPPSRKRAGHMPGPFAMSHPVMPGENLLKDLQVEREIARGRTPPAGPGQHLYQGEG